MKPKHTSRLIFPALILAGSLVAPFAQAASQTWDGGGGDGNWSTLFNWLGDTAAPGATSGTTNADVATFNAGIANTWGNSVGNPIIIDSTTQNIGGINFDTSAGNYFIGSTVGNSLLLSSGGSIQILATLSATNAIETINAPLIIQGGGGTYTFANHSANGSGAGAGTLNIGGSITGGAAGATVLTLSGSNTNSNTISGVIANGSATTLGITKDGAGTWNLSGVNTYTGGATVNGGTLNINSIGALNSATTTNAVAPGGQGSLVLNNGTTISNTSGGALTFVDGAFGDHSTTDTRKLVSISLNGSVTFDGAADGSKNLFFSRMGDNNVSTVTLLSNSTVDVTNGIFNIGTKIAGAFSLTKNGVGELQAGNFNNTLAFTGGLTVNEGTFTGSSPQKAFGDGLVSLGDTTPANSKNATLAYSSENQGNNNNVLSTNSLTVNAGSSGSLAFVTKNTNANGVTGLSGTVTLNNDLTLAAKVATTTTQLSGVVSGGGGLRIGDATHSNLGKVTLSGANTYTGATTVTSGTLQLGAGSTTGTLSTSSTITNNANFTINRSNAVVQGTDFSAAAITGTGSFTQAGTGTTTLNAANTYTGATTVTAGTLQLGDGSTTGTLSTSSAITTNGNFTINRSNAVVQGTDFSAAAITGTGSLTQAGAGTTTLNAANTYTGATTLTSGTLSVATIGNGGVSGNLGAASTAPSNLVFNGGTLQYTGATASTNRNFTINAGTTATFDITANHLTVTGAATGTNGALTKTGAGTLTLGGANTYTGATTISAGILKLQAGVAAPVAPVAGYARWFDASTIVGTNGASISTWADDGLGADATVPGGNSAPTLISDAGTGTGLSALQFAKNTNATNSGALTFTRDSNIRSVFSIFKGASFLLTDTDTYQFHRGGTYNSSATDVLWDGAPNNYSSANIRNGKTYVNGTAVNGTTFAMPTNLHNGYNLVSMITDENAVEANGFNKDRTYNSGDQSQAEVLIYDFALDNTQRQAVEAYLNYKWFGIGSASAAPLSSASPVSIAASATLDLNGVTQQIASLSGPSGSSVTNTGTTDSLLTISGASSTDFGGVISDGGTNKISLAKSGASIQTLSGTNTYTGVTSVNAGSLVINGDQSAATGAVTVAAGATNATAVRLKGIGTVGGNTTFAADPDAAGAQVGGIHSPGNSVGKQTFDAPGAAVTNLTYNTGSIFEWELASTPAATEITTDLPGAYASNRGAAYDAVNVTGTLGGTDAIFRVVLDGTQTFADAFWDTNRTWTDIFRTGDGSGTSNVNYASIFAGGFQYYNYSGVGSTLAALTTPTIDGSFSITGSTLTWSAVPEPSSALAGLLLGAGLLRRRRSA